MAISKKVILGSLIIIPIFFLINPAFSENLIIWNGEDSIYYGGLVRASEEFTKKTGIKVIAIPGGCDSGIKGIEAGKISVGVLCCFPKDTELQKGIKVHQYAWEALAIVVNNANPITNLTAQQVRDIFSGKITNWKDVGGQDKPIKVITRLHCKDRYGHWKQILNDSALFKSSKDVKEDQEVLLEVGKDPDTIAFISMNMINPKFVKIVSVNGVKPSKDSLVNGSYPWKMPISFITKGEPKEVVKQFIDFVSGEGRAYMNKDMAFIRRDKKDLKKVK